MFVCLVVVCLFPRLSLPLVCISAASQLSLVVYLSVISLLSLCCLYTVSLPLSGAVSLAGWFEDYDSDKSAASHKEQYAVNNHS